MGLDEFTATIWAPSSTRTQGQGVRPSQTLCRTRAPPTAWSSVTRPLRRPSLKRAPSTRPSPQQGLVPPTLSTGRHFTETTEAGGKKPTASPASYRSRPGLFPALALCYWWGGGGGGTRKTEGAPTTSRPAGMWAPPGQAPSLAHPWVPRPEPGSELTAPTGH